MVKVGAVCTGIEAKLGAPHSQGARRERTGAAFLREALACIRGGWSVLDTSTGRRRRRWGGGLYRAQGGPGTVDLSFRSS